MPKGRAEPALKDRVFFPYSIGDLVSVEYDQEFYDGQVHRIAVDNRSCTIVYDVDGSMEAPVVASRIRNRSDKEAADDVDDTQGFDESGDNEPVGEIRFKRKKTVAALNQKFAKARVKTLKHKAKWCCGQRHDMPYFAAKSGSDGYLQLQFTHGTVGMTAMCNLAGCSIPRIDEYLYLHGALVTDAQQLSMTE